jgi:hypothetical protein
MELGEELEGLVLDNEQTFKDLLCTNTLCWIERKDKENKVIQLLNMRDLKVFVTIKFTYSGLYIFEYGEKTSKRTSKNQYNRIISNYQEIFSKKRSLALYNIVDLRPKEKT